MNNLARIPGNRLPVVDMRYARNGRRDFGRQIRKFMDTGTE